MCMSVCGGDLFPVAKIKYFCLKCVWMCDHSYTRLCVCVCVGTCALFIYLYVNFCLVVSTKKQTFMPIILLLKLIASTRVHIHVTPPTPPHTPTPSPPPPHSLTPPTPSPPPPHPLTRLTPSQVQQLQSVLGLVEDEEEGEGVEGCGQLRQRYQRMGFLSPPPHQLHIETPGTLYHR